MFCIQIEKRRAKRYVFRLNFILITLARKVVIDIIEFRTHSLDEEFLSSLILHL